MTQEEFFTHFKPHGAGAGFRAQIPFGENMEISVVAGAFFYSTPRVDADNANVYTAFEVAFFEKSEEKTEWASYNKLSQLGVFEVIGKGEYENIDDEDRDKPGTNVFGWVNIGDILKILSK